ncbi:MAG: alpha-hydroxy-acid oxidizing protein [Novosphingobium sp.]|jgi:isopentenyl diphosphate isomerase/L-lactate dehydrogenase-like FMN-dependent dehydrogenase|nr:alpha-hydroxy-acid oxidizing protein [Novosphingobium sp.]
MTRLAKAQNIDELAAMARRRLPRGLFEYLDRGAEDEVTMRGNADSIKRVYLRQRVAIDVSGRDAATEVLGIRQSLPIGIAATGLASLIHHEGESKLASAAAAAGVPFTIGTSNFTSQAKLQEICGDLLWRLIYPNKRREIVEHHIAKAREAGIRTIVITMDSAVTGNREYLRHSGFQPGATNARTFAQVLAAPHWLFGTFLPYMLAGGFPEFADMPEGERKFWGGTFSWAALADDFTWDDVRAIRKRWKGNLVLKGLSTAEDARAAAACGVDGIIVSNHGGRMLDGCIPSFMALPEIVDAVAPGVTVMVDGGFKRGADVLKAIALGAASVWVGRATLYGLAAGGEAGAARALAIFRAEIDRAMALLGCGAIADIGRGHVTA